MDKQLLNDITKLVQAFNDQLQAQLPLLENEINELIESKNNNSKTIEHILDTLLSLTKHGVGEQLFIKLLNYYKLIDKEGAMFYWDEFDSTEN